MKHLLGILVVAFLFNLVGCSDAPSSSIAQDIPDDGDAGDNGDADDAGGEDARESDIIEEVPADLEVSVSATPSSGNAPLPVSFTCEGSGGTPPLTFVWDFGDGRLSDGADATHTYQGAGTFEANCTITDAEGSTASASASLVVTDLCESVVCEEGQSCDPLDGQCHCQNNEWEGDFDGDVAQLVGYGVIKGTLAITANNELTDLDALACLTTIQGSLFLHENNALERLDGLASLTSVGEDLVISRNNALNDLQGLSSLTVLSGSLTIRENEALENIQGLNSMTAVGGTCASRKTLSWRTSMGLCRSPPSAETSSYPAMMPSTTSADSQRSQPWGDVSAS